MHERIIGHYIINGVRIPLVELTPSTRDIMYGMAQAKLVQLAEMGNPDAIAEISRRASQ